MAETRISTGIEEARPAAFPVWRAGTAVLVATVLFAAASIALRPYLWSYASAQVRARPVDSALREQRPA